MFEDFKKVQEEIGVLSKSESNPFYHSNYLALPDLLAAIKPILLKNNFVLIQTPQCNDSGDYLCTRILHKSSDSIEGKMRIVSQNPNDPQKVGAGITYMRRYSLTAMLGIEEEDDDGNTASGKKEEPQTIESFQKTIASAKSERQLNALWYQWKEIFAKESDEYKKLNKLSSDKKLQIKEPDLIVKER